jgi:hypothetical protein
VAKRIPLSDRRAEDARGIDSIFKPSAPPEITEKPGEVAPEPQPTKAPTEEVRGDEPAPPLSAPSPPVSPTAAERQTLAKVTLYIRPDQVEAIEEIQLAQRRKTGKKPDKSDLVQEALDLLAEKYRSQ